MYRVISAFFAVLISLVAASAQTPSAQNPSGPNPSGPNSSAPNSSAQIPSDSRLKSIIDKKTIRIAYRTDAAPFAFTNDRGEPAGFSLDLCQMVAKSIAQQVGVPDLKVEWVPVTVQTRFTAITDGQADLECGSSTVTLGRLKQVDFSNYIFVEFHRRGRLACVESQCLRRHGGKENRRHRRHHQ